MCTVLFATHVWGGEAALPDLTKGTSSIDRSLTYNLGATGMRGWIYTPHDPENIASREAEYGRQTGSSRQILVTHVGATECRNQVRTRAEMNQIES